MRVSTVLCMCAGLMCGAVSGCAEEAAVSEGTMASERAAAQGLLPAAEVGADAPVFVAPPSAPRFVDPRENAALPENPGGVHGDRPVRAIPGLGSGR